MNCNNHMKMCIRDSICPLGFIERRTAVQLIRDKITDGLRIIANDRKILAQVDTLNDIVHNERLCQKSAERTKSCLCIKHKTRSYDNPQIHQMCIRDRYTVSLFLKPADGSLHLPCPCQGIGVTGFEPATSRPPAVRATKLRHTPFQMNGFIISYFL